MHSNTDTPRQPKDSQGSASAAPCSALPLPKASYPCLNEYCAEEVSYPPDMLFWVDDGEIRGWLCENCWDEHDWNNDEIPPKGISLENEIIRQQNAEAMASADTQTPKDNGTL